MQTPPTAPADTGNQAGAQTCAPTTLTLAALPAIGAALAGGLFAGLTTQADGSYAAVVLLPDRGSDLSWQQATDWAAERAGVLPTRPIAALLYAQVKAHLPKRWHWTSETHQDDASYAWFCGFYDGNQGYNRKSFQACAVSVRLIPFAWIGGFIVGYQNLSHESFQACAVSARRVAA